MKRAPLVLIGLDGATFSLLDQLCEQGHMPFLHSIRQQALEGIIESTTPISTLTAWSSLLTGQEPAVHGVVDFFTRRARNLPLEPIHGGWRQTTTFLEHLDDAGFAVAAIGIPGTYPAIHLKHGICISGFDAPGADSSIGKATWPYSLGEKIQAQGGWNYGAINEFYRGYNWIEDACQKLCQDIQQKQRIVGFLQNQVDWDLFFVHLQASDTAGHHFWHLYDKQSPRFIPGYEHILPKVFRCIDTFIRTTFEQFPKDSQLMLVSDHGMVGTNDTAIYLNRLLEKMHLYSFPTIDKNILSLGKQVVRSCGHFSLEKLSASNLRYVKSKLPQEKILPWFQWLRQHTAGNSLSLAFSDELDYSPSIWLSEQSKTLTEQSKTNILQQIRQALLLLCCPKTSERLIKNVWFRSDLPQGDCLTYLPDICIEPHLIAGYRPVFLASQTTGPIIENLGTHNIYQTSKKGYGLPGAHRREGCLIWFHRNMQHARSIGSITLPQLGATLPLLWLSQSPWPTTHATMAANIVQMKSTEQYQQNRSSFSSSQMQQTMQRLQDLGYID